MKNVLNENTIVSLRRGKKYALHVTEEGVTFSSSNPRVATVTQQGEVGAVQVGMAVISAFIDDTNAGSVLVTVAK